MSQSLLNRPNILLILVDSLRIDRLGCYGYTRNISPVIDRLASEGALYENAIAASSWTLQATASLFTGLYPSQHGASWGNQFLDESHVTLAQILRLAGYHNVGWSTNPWVSRRTGLDRGFDEFIQLSSAFQTRSSNRWQITFDRILINLREVFNDKGGEFLTRIATRNFPRLAKAHQPFFAFMFYLEPHMPYRARNRTARRMLPAEVKLSVARRINWRPNSYYSGKISMSKNDFEILGHLYDAEIADTDRRIGQTIKALEESGVLDDTVVIICADHGENIGHHNLMGHSHCLYDDLIRVPLIIRYPKIFRAGTRIEDQVQVHDLVTSLTRLAGVDENVLSHLSHRYSLLPEDLQLSRRTWTFAQRIRPPYEEFFALQDEVPNFDPAKYLRELYAIRGDSWKYIHASDGHQELFNLDEDPTECSNLYNLLPETARKLHETLEGELAIPCTAQETATTLDKATIDRLRALGYLE